MEASSCIFYNTSAGCRNGDQCRFSHIDHLTPSSIESSGIVCRYWKGGWCKKQDACPWLHPSPITIPTIPLFMPMVPSPVPVPIPPPNIPSMLSSMFDSTANLPEDGVYDWYRRADATLIHPFEYEEFGRTKGRPREIEVFVDRGVSHRLTVPIGTSSRLLKQRLIQEHLVKYESASEFVLVPQRVRQQSLEERDQLHSRLTTVGLHDGFHAITSEIRGDKISSSPLDRFTDVLPTIRVLEEHVRSLGDIKTFHIWDTHAFSQMWIRRRENLMETYCQDNSIGILHTGMSCIVDC